jgi:hypothetical protein
MSVSLDELSCHGMAWHCDIWTNHCILFVRPQRISDSVGRLNHCISSEYRRPNIAVPMSVSLDELSCHGMATISKLLQIIGLFFRIPSLL